MAPVATSDSTTTNGTTNGVHQSIEVLKAKAASVFNPFYSPDTGDDADGGYQYAKYKPYFPDVHWEPLGPQEVTERGLFADPEKKRFQHLTPALGTEISGIDLRQLSDKQKDELALLIAERGVVFFRDQEINVHEQLELGRYWGPLHKHATTPIPKEPGLEEVHVVYNDGSRRPDPTSFSKLELWHSDVSYELQPPSTTSLKVITGPPLAISYALYSSFSPGFQKYLEGLYAVHSGVAQADGSRAAGKTVRREPVESIHPVVRVNPATGWKSVYVNPGFTRRIVGLPKAESDAVLQLLFRLIAENPDFQVRFHWEPNSIAFWDNRVVTHSATFDFWPHPRHALRSTPHGEKPTSVAEYESSTGKVAKDRQLVIWEQEGVLDKVLEGSNPANGAGANGQAKPRGYSD
ncbi:alpha-ketoglutarate-dependent sulfonate dioxygenase [Fomitopsis serialis]|uniref:alpha-ketoglutarate-dependent sulfonate dioxygenase n=1 Tax=Fomitopsis serialis TaxID=139415 RepID=UPI002008B791|nr:alpha-ketoglutarate-dependent sulfonate dioxygenase [Neoantrodia serialis]KAH9928390.1 alpha-ketoglutarate-dependent sulfonate dioxygenase [Neoantrodia serialis]